ncbi:MULTISPECIES: hypothetical protein [unclassified Ruminococcus]|uniref:hypothetical protein n=1 Tax=unclassified Ruminococcus TaxID=2608920 RepID=UPI00210A5DF1|nr:MULTISPECIES: hypothetical protein [unclassified Ruminococcus]MCQ4023347.1 hypothetical protein [Ruminococcus sp. zg-924]MCQ4115373.1 hypothetical protein [Ruminococcus sp. zg-921]
MKKYKVIIWGLGNVGRSALIHTQTKKSLDLVAVYDVDPKKVGKDAGEAIGIEKVGVIVTDNREAVLNADADVVLYYAPQMYDGAGFEQPHMGKNCDEICEILSHKHNVITSACIYYSKVQAPEIYDKIDKTAKANGVTYVQQGIFPGLYTPYLPIILAMGSRNTKSVKVYGGEPDELNTAPWAALLAFGKKPDEIDKAMVDAFHTRFLCDYGGSVKVIADKLGLEYDEYEQNYESIMSDRDYDTKNPMFGVVKKGTIGAHRLNMVVKKNGEEIVGFHFVHKASRNILPEIGLDFKVEIEGENKIVANVEGFLPEYCDVFLTSAAPNVNLIPGLVAAEPGYKDAIEVAVIQLPE